MNDREPEADEEKQDVEAGAAGLRMAISRAEGWALFIGTMALMAFLFFIVRPAFFGPSYRSPVSRVHSDMRTMATALETYYVDHGEYPASSTNTLENLFTVTATRDRRIYDRLPTFMTRGPNRELETLTTPVSYMTIYFTDPFSPVKGEPFCYWRHNGRAAGWILWSAGPDRDYDLTIDNVAQAYDPALANPLPYIVEHATYDPTNGVPSNGDIHRLKE